MIDPFDIEGPALVSFSGGRTSAYMLRRILDQGLRSDVFVAFANTGKERPETLDFVLECSQRWNVPIAWLEYRPDAIVAVTHETASRNGEPFDLLVEKRGLLPNPVARFCTQELKIRVMRDFMTARGFEHWTNVVGIRADEPRRVARMKAPNRERWENHMPLASAGIEEKDVLAFWSSQPFDLRLRPWEGNCDLCFLKSRKKKERILFDRPDLATWWIVKEKRHGSFRRDCPPIDRLLENVRAQLRLFDHDDDEIADCFCSD